MLITTQQWLIFLLLCHLLAVPFRGCRSESSAPHLAPSSASLSRLSLELPFKDSDDNYLDNPPQSTSSNELELDQMTN